MDNWLCAMRFLSKLRRQNESLCELATNDARQKAGFSLAFFAAM